MLEEDQQKVFEVQRKFPDDQKKVLEECLKKKAKEVSRRVLERTICKERKAIKKFT